MRNDRAVVPYKGGGRSQVERIVVRTRRTWLENVVRGAKALAGSISFARGGLWAYGADRFSGALSSGGNIDYRERAGNGRNNAIVQAALELLSSTFAQSPIVVKKIVGDQENVVPNHDMVKLLNNPNPYYSGKLLWKATVIDYAFGNAYWLKVRSGAGKPVQLYWVPSDTIKPMWPTDDPTVFISHYEYTPNGVKTDVPVEDVVHLRNGMDPRNIRKGLSPLGALLREIATDEEAAEFTHTILRNLGVTGMVISPADGKGHITEPDALKIKAQVMQRTTGDRRGEPLVIGSSARVDQMGVDMGAIDLAGIRHVPEERITSMFGTPAVLLGLGTGLENATFSNVDGLRRIFYENKVIPLQDFISADVHVSLLGEFVGDPNTFVIGFDNEGVRVLKEDENATVERQLSELGAGGMTLNEYRAERGREPMPVDMYMLSSRIIPVAVDKVLEQHEPTPAAAAAGAPGDGTDTSSNAGNGADNAGDATANSGDSSANDAQNGKGNKQDIRTKDVGDAVTRIRARMQAQCGSDVQGYLIAQRDAVLAQVTNTDGKAREKLRINWPRVQEDFDTLRGVLEPWYKRALVAVHDVVQDVLDERYELSGADERTYLKSAALNIKGINEYTRNSVAGAVTASTDAGETAEQLRARIADLNVFSAERAYLIARTELATSVNLAQLESYKASGIVVGVRITDGDADKVCAAVDGMKVPISEARSIPPLGHPNCVRRFWHITDANELADSEAA